MKYIWEEHDIFVGRRFQAAHRPNEIWMIGYDASRGDARLAVISTLDGMISRIGSSAAELSQLFNKNNYRPIDIRCDSDVGKDSQS